MNWNRDKNSSEEKAVESRNTIACWALGEEKFKQWIGVRDKNSSEEKAVNGEIYCMLSFGGEV